MLRPRPSPRRTRTAGWISRAGAERNGRPAVPQRVRQPPSRRPRRRAPVGRPAAVAPQRSRGCKW
eukprot:7154838-Pyramimonas_sp.AAC.1